MLKRNLIIGLMVAAGIVVSTIGVSKVSANINKRVNFIKSVTSERAKQIMLEKVPGGTILEFSYYGEGLKPKYDGKLIAGDFEYEVDVDAKTGEVITFEKEKVAISNNVVENKSNEQAQAAVETTVENNQVATQEPVVTPVEPQAPVEPQPQVPAPTPQAPVVQTQAPVNTNQNSAASTAGVMSQDQAKSIMQSKVPAGAVLTKFKFDYDDGRPEYEAEFILGTIEYEIEIDAITGAVLDYSQESIYD